MIHLVLNREGASHIFTQALQNITIVCLCNHCQGLRRTFFLDLHKV
jgi:hypothetical protein